MDLAKELIAKGGEKLHLPVDTHCGDDFGEQPEVLNGCSDLMTEVFGAERGTHSRSAVGTNSLPRQMPVEIEMVVEIE